MSDTISREALITVMETLCDESKPLDVLIRNVSVAAIKKAPAVDAVDVVRCKDCKHNYDDLVGLICVKGPCVDCIVPEDFYCPYGERKEVSE